MKIVSRLDVNQAAITKLQQIVTVLFDEEIEPADGLVDLVEQLDMGIASLIDDLSAEERRNERLSQDNLGLAVKVAQANCVLDVLHDGAAYDEHLDCATVDLMEAFLCSGAAESTFDGDLSFSEDVVFSRADLKPILKDAIDSWLNSKLKE